MQDAPKLDPRRTKITELSFRKSAGGISSQEEQELKRLQEEEALNRRAAVTGTGDNV